MTPSTTEETTIEESIEDALLQADYIRASSKLIVDALREECDVLQMTNGDVVITATRLETYKYHWDAKKKKLLRTTLKKPHKKAADYHKDPKEPLI